MLKDGAWFLLIRALTTTKTNHISPRTLASSSRHYNTVDSVWNGPYLFSTKIVLAYVRSVRAKHTWTRPLLSGKADLGTSISYVSDAI